MNHLKAEDILSAAIEHKNLIDKLIISADDTATYERVCECRTPGLDDGDYTCWVHHNCNTGDCTHAEED